MNCIFSCNNFCFLLWITTFEEGLLDLLMTLIGLHGVVCGFQYVYTSTCVTLCICSRPSYLNKLIKVNNMKTALETSLIGLMPQRIFNYLLQILCYHPKNEGQKLIFIQFSSSWVKNTCKSFCLGSKSIFLKGKSNAFLKVSHTHIENLQFVQNRSLYIHFT